MTGIPKQAKAVVFHGANTPFELRSFPLPKLAPYEILVRVETCTLCGSDLHTVQGHRAVATPTILGHEILGEVSAIGPGEPPLDLRGKEIHVGQRVTWSIAASCGSCFFCSSGLPQKCESLFKYGHRTISDDHPLSGGLAEYVHLVAGTSVLIVPRDVPDAVLAPAGCAGATVAAALRVAGNCRGRRILIFGAGTLGLTACAMARSRGAAYVLALDPDPQRRKLACDFGAHLGFDPAEGTRSLRLFIEKISEGRGVDIVFELSGAIDVTEDMLELLRFGGRLVLVGAVDPRARFEVAQETLVRRCLSIHGVHNYAPQDLVKAVDFLVRAHHRLPFADLVTKSFPLQQAERAFACARDTRAPRVAIAGA